jgi:hypothetical protein
MNLQEIQNKLLELNVNEYTEKKNGLTYLSWANAWREILKQYPTANYEIIKAEDGQSYFGDERVGYMVHTKVTIENVTREMWLPVMDNQNKAMRLEEYEITTKYKTIKVNAMTMFDVNTAIMRCLTKNLAMFGLGLYIYKGEDLPEQPDKSEEISELLAKINTVEELQEFFKDNKGKYDSKVFNKLVTARKQ